MVIYTPLEQLEKKYSINSKESMARGSRGKIFRVGDGIITKIPFNITNGNLRSDKTALFQLFKEYNNQKLAVDLGLKFPQPHGIYAIQEMQSGGYFPGLVMDELEGEDFNQLEDCTLCEARKLRDAELANVKDAGMVFEDNHKGNAFLTKDGQVYLLDAAGLGFSRNF